MKVGQAISHQKLQRGVGLSNTLIVEFLHMEPHAIRLLDGILPHPDPGVSLWIGDLDRLTREVANVSSLLSHAERQQGERFRFSIHRNRYLATRCFERTVLGRALKIDPESVRIERTPLGKPFVRDSEVRYSLSHSENVAVIALATREVGVDIEHLRELPDADELASRMFPLQDAELIVRLPQPRQSTRFLQQWVLREAVLKATGEGLQGRMRMADLTIRHFKPEMAVESQGQRWRLFSFAPSPTVTGGMAIAN